ncbi:hypothetical protein QW131_26875 [Roseibium salinum]|nr:hypothetical protein [Roseibium salinum]
MSERTEAALRDRIGELMKAGVSADMEKLDSIYHDDIVVMDLSIDGRLMTLKKRRTSWPCWSKPSRAKKSGRSHVGQDPQCHRFRRPWACSDFAEDPGWRSEHDDRPEHRLRFSRTGAGRSPAK